MTYADLYTIVGAIAVAPADAVGGIVSQLRSGTAVDAVAASAKRWSSSSSSSSALVPKRENENELGMVRRWGRKSPQRESRVITGKTYLFTLVHTDLLSRG